MGAGARAARAHTNTDTHTHTHTPMQATDEVDPFFLFTLDVGEDDFHELKRDQSLLVDFEVCVCIRGVCGVGGGGGGLR